MALNRDEFLIDLIRLIELEYVATGKVPADLRGILLDELAMTDAELANAYARIEETTPQLQV